MNDLSMQVAQVDDVVIDDGQSTDAGTGEQRHYWSGESTRTHNQHPRVIEPPLTGNTDLRKEQVSGISLGVVAVSGDTAA
jgi:hypothetical protein